MCVGGGGVICYIKAMVYMVCKIVLKVLQKGRGVKFWPKWCCVISEQSVSGLIVNVFHRLLKGLS